jgi:Kef-type K+ transport system membrane component KefB/nucleotide-binding universal stress UspA family protein
MCRREGILPMTHDASVVVFIAELAALLVAARLAGEFAQRLGQPPVMGQIIAGVLLGPSVLGAIAPALWHSLFPGGAEQHAMLDAVAQLGVLLLLLMTGMETDLSVFRDARRAAISISVSGIAVPFVCGIVLGVLLPQSLLPDPSRRSITALFLGTALAISSVKIVALVVRDLGFVRRTVGQIIIAAAILDDTIGWLIISVTFGLALHGTIDLVSVSRIVLGTVAFLVLSFTIGRPLVHRIIRWSGDHLTGELASLSVILVIAALLALLTAAIGVHLVLGAFVAGILIGQSPTLTRRIEAQLRGLIIALFMPVFFAVAGLSTDLKALAGSGLALTGALIALASVGKFLGAFIGGRVGGLSYAESFAVGCGMNARGSTEIIVASIGLSMGALDQRLFTAVVAMAVVTTLAMPPMLRLALQRLPMSSDERSRIEREQLEAQGFLKQIERLLVAVDASPSGQLASHLVGLLAGVRRIPTTVLQLDRAPPGQSAAVEGARRSAAAVAAGAEAGEEVAEVEAYQVDITTRAGIPGELDEAIATEARKGYGLLVIGREPSAAGSAFEPLIARSAARFGGAFAIAIARGAHRRQPAATALHILVPVTGTRVSRQGAELAIALAQASHGTVTALYVANPPRLPLPWRARVDRAIAPRLTAEAAVREIVGLGKRYGVAVSGRIRTVGARQNAILREVQSGRHDLLVMGVSPRSGDLLFFGELPAEILDRAECSLLFVSADPAIDATTAAAAARSASPER